MKQETETAIKTLIAVNHDREKGYSLAAVKTSRDELKRLFTYFSNQSKSFTEDLTPFAAQLKTAEKPEQNAEPNRWPSVNNEVSETDANAILSSCEFGEDAAKRTYDEVMEHTEYLPSDVYDVISGHRTELHKTHNLLRSLYFNF